MKRNPKTKSEIHIERACKRHNAVQMVKVIEVVPAGISCIEEER